jgi:hypothetical protein
MSFDRSLYANGRGLAATGVVHFRHTAVDADPILTRDKYRKGTYYAIVKIEEKMDVAFHMLEKPTKSIWVNMQPEESLRFSRVEAEDRRTQKSARRGVKGLKIKAPVFDEFKAAVRIHYDITAVPDLLAFKEVSLSDKRHINRLSFIRKKLLVRR